MFDTGMHYIGSMADGEILNHFLRYCGIYDSLRLQRLDEAFDVIHLSDREYSFCQGYDLVVTEVERADVVRRHAHHHPQVGGNSDTCYNLIAHNDMQLKDRSFRAAA